MTSIIAEPCIETKDVSCFNICPVCIQNRRVCGPATEHGVVNAPSE